MWGYTRTAPSISRIASDRTLLYAAATFAAATVATSAAIPTVYVEAILIATVVVIAPISVAIGGAAGVIVHDLFYGAAGYWTPVVSMWILAFAGAIAWLSPEPIGRRVDRRGRQIRGTVLAYIGVAIPAGIYATIAGAWLATVLSGEPFYTAATTLLFGVPITVGVGTGILVAMALRERSNARDSSDRSTGAEQSETDGGTRQWFDTRTMTLVGFAVLGGIWLVGTVLLDIVARDLGLFVSEVELTDYVVGVVGGDSLVSTVVVAALTSIYRYGDVAVLLSAPIAVVTIGLYARYRADTPVWGRSYE